MGWDQNSSREGPSASPGRTRAVCSLLAPLTAAQEAATHHPTPRPLLSSEQFAQLHARELAWGTAHSQMLGGDEARHPVQGQRRETRKEWGWKEGWLSGIASDSRFLALPG